MRKIIETAKKKHHSPQCSEMYRAQIEFYSIEFKLNSTPISNNTSGTSKEKLQIKPEVNCIFEIKTFT